ncbi:hypothetical protein A1D22_07390 [Pasteurellaceae bacterium LFhippo2]|nr:hypothetical protein [Pasteurellaceae bacterium LFhippo2]
MNQLSHIYGGETALSKTTFLRKAERELFAKYPKNITACTLSLQKLLNAIFAVSLPKGESWENFSKHQNEPTLPHLWGRELGKLFKTSKLTKLSHIYGGETALSKTTFLRKAERGLLAKHLQNITPCTLSLQKLLNAIFAVSLPKGESL